MSWVVLVDEEALGVAGGVVEPLPRGLTPDAITIVLLR
jgi:hypothetical protein